MSARDGGPAFPRPHSWDESPVTGIHEGDRVQPFGAQDGMTLRDYFAAQVLAGIVAHGRTLELLPQRDGPHGLQLGVAVGDMAEAAYTLANAMLAERAK